MLGHTGTLGQESAHRSHEGETPPAAVPHSQREGNLGLSPPTSRPLTSRPPSQVSIWHRDITLVTPKQLRGSPRPQHAQYQIYGRHKRRPQPLPREAAQHRRLASQHRQSRHTAAVMTSVGSVGVGAGDHLLSPVSAAFPRPAPDGGGYITAARSHEDKYINQTRGQHCNIRPHHLKDINCFVSCRHSALLSSVSPRPPLQSRHVPHPHPPPPPPQDKQPPSLPEVRTKEERLPESSEVVIDPRGHVTQRPAARCQHVARGLKPSYAASARKVLMSSGRGLLRLQGSLGRGRSASPQSLYVNDQFPEAAPCPAQGCPLNPRTRVRLLPAACLRYILILTSLAS